MNICLSVTNLEPGGAQTFVIRLAAQLAQLGHNVHIYDHWPEFRRSQLIAELPPTVKIHSYCDNSILRNLVWKMNALLQAARIQPAFRHRLNERRFRKTIVRNRIQVLNSHMSFSDFICAGIRIQGCAFIPTLHGEYELGFAEHRDQHHFRTEIQRVVKNSHLIIYTADKNLRPLKKFAPPRECIKIGIGVNREDLRRVKPANRLDFGIGDNDFVVGMVSRGIPEKSWDTAITALQRARQLTSRKIIFLLVGEGDYLARLVRTTASELDLHLSFTGDYWKYLSMYPLFDLFLFPSVFAGESAPNVVIESLCFNVPVLTTRHAEMPDMIGAGTDQAAGICVNPGPDLAEEMGRQIARLTGDQHTLEKLKANCPRAFASFDIDSVASRYIESYTHALRSVTNEKTIFRKDA